MFYRLLVQWEINNKNWYKQNIYSEDKLLITLNHIKLWYDTTQHSTAQHSTAQHSTTLHYTTLHYTTLHYTTLHYTTLHYTTPHHTTPHHTTLHYMIWSLCGQVLILLGVYLALGLLAISIIVIFVPNLSAKDDQEAKSTKFSLRQVVQTLQHMTNPLQLLMIPLNMYIGMEEGYMMAEYSLVGVYQSRQFMK